MAAARRVKAVMMFPPMTFLEVMAGDSPLLVRQLLQSEPVTKLSLEMAGAHCTGRGLLRKVSLHPTPGPD
jgi:hypothetical protein